MPLAVNTAPTTEPVTLAELKEHLRVDSIDEDGYITTIGQAARRHLEQICWSSFVTQTWDLWLDEFPKSADRWEESYVIYLPRSPVSSITSITYTDTNGNSATVATADYVLDDISRPARIKPSFGNDWPESRQVHKAVKVIYVAGYGAAAAVPTEIKQAIKLLAEHYWQFRGVVCDKFELLPFSVKSLIDPYRILDTRVLEFV